jgi:hypothetical protein
MKKTMATTIIEVGMLITVHGFAIKTAVICGLIVTLEHNKLINKEESL